MDNPEHRGRDDDNRDRSEQRDPYREAYGERYYQNQDDTWRRESEEGRGRSSEGDFWRGREDARERRRSEEMSAKLWPSDRSSGRDRSWGDRDRYSNDRYASSSDDRGRGDRSGGDRYSSQGRGYEDEYRRDTGRGYGGGDWGFSGGEQRGDRQRSSQGGRDDRERDRTDDRQRFGASGEQQRYAQGGQPSGDDRYYRGYYGRSSTPYSFEGGSGNLTIESWGISGPYSGRGPKGYRRPDQQIMEEACQRLERDGHIDASEIEVTAEDGVIKLEGTVNSREEKRRAEECVESVYGARDVMNHLRVARGEQFGRQQDTSQTGGQQSAGQRTGGQPGGGTQQASGQQTGGQTTGGTESQTDKKSKSGKGSGTT
jgi:osmotically-inducible protein OsmY